MLDHRHDRVAALAAGVGVARALQAIGACDRGGDELEVRVLAMHRVAQHLGQRHVVQAGLDVLDGRFHSRQAWTLRNAGDAARHRAIGSVLGNLGDCAGTIAELANHRRQRVCLLVNLRAQQILRAGNPLGEAIRLLGQVGAKLDEA